MMRYALLADLYARFSEEEINALADTDGTGTPDPLNVSRALEDAQEEIDLALRGRYRLPLARVPKILTRWTCDLAYEALHTKAVPDAVKDRADAVRKLLLQVAAGKMMLDLEEELQSSSGMVEIVSGRAHSPFASPSGIRNQETGIR
jgi:phage gp36-like protein